MLTMPIRVAAVVVDHARRRRCRAARGTNLMARHRGFKLFFSGDCLTFRPSEGDAIHGR
jgi:hypothetical protein